MRPREPRGRSTRQNGEAWAAGGGERQPARDDHSTRRPTAPRMTPNRSARALRTCPGAIRIGPASAPAAARTATTIWNRLSPPRPRWRTGCASSLRLPSSIPAAHDRTIPHRSGRRGRLSHRRSRRGGGKTRHQRRRDRGGARHPAEVRSARRVRARSRRMPGDPAHGARSFRSRHAGAGRAARSFGAARIYRVEEDLRRRRRGSRRHDRGNPQAQSEAGARVRLGAGAADRAGRFCAAGARRRLDRRTQLRHAAEGPGQSELLFAEVSATARRDTEKSYLSECLQSATWLVRALDQRARTILKVSNEIVRQQDAFFAHGVEHLRPLNLKTVAEAIGMHESTVSRVTANKYMATSRGIFELKYFFTSAIAAAHGGEAHSAEAVRHRIKQLIDAESATDVLSDDTIVEKVARRRHRHRAAHGGEIPRSDAHSVVGAAPARKAGCGGALNRLAARNCDALTRCFAIPSSS